MLVSDRVIKGAYLLVLCCGVTTHVCLCACVLRLFLRKPIKQGLLLIALYTTDV